ncbi:MAG: MOSC domain-containing protein [Calditrichia bacterium]
MNKQKKSSLAVTTHNKWLSNDGIFAGLLEYYAAYSKRQLHLNSKRIGQIKKLVRYPVKSMAGIEMDEALLGWHGLTGDRRFGVRKVDKAGDFPWLTAGRMPELLLYKSVEFDANLLPKKVQTPSGELLDITSKELRAEIHRQSGHQVELMALKHGIFDDAVISLIASATAAHVCSEAGVSADSRRFRANIEISCDQPSPFAEDDWVGSVISFGESANAPAVHITKRDIRCKMISLDPDTAEHSPIVLKTAVQLNDNNAGVYGTVIRTGTIKVGDALLLLNCAE